MVGIVGDVKQDGLDTDPSSSLYQAEKQQSLGQLSLVVRTTVKPETLISPITATLQQLDPTKPLRNVRTMQSIVEESIADRRLSMFMLAAFSGLALILAAFGLYSVLAYTVRRRFREIGIRMALGAGEADVLRIVALEGDENSFREGSCGILDTTPGHSRAICAATALSAPRAAADLCNSAVTSLCWAVR